MNQLLPVIERQGRDTTETESGHRRSGKPIRPRTRPRRPEFLTPLMPCNVATARCPVSRDRASHRILIMRVGAFGDILMGTPLLAALRRAYPLAHLTWIAEHNHVQAIDANPYIDEILRWDGAYWKRALRRGLPLLWLARALRFGGVLRAKNYDTFVSFQPEEWPLLALGAGAKTRIGVFDTFRRYYGHSQNLHYRKFYTHSYAEPGLPAHRADQYLLLLDALGLETPPSQKMSMGFTGDDVRLAERWLRWRGVDPQGPYAVLAPGTSWPTKDWPAERYASVADALAREEGCRIVLMGGVREGETIAAVAARMAVRPATLVGSLTFRQAAAVVSRAQIVVSGDTGPMHMAAALDTPQVALFGPTAPEWYGPRGGSRSLTLTGAASCAPCDKKKCALVGADHLRCLHGIGVGDVLKAALSLSQNVLPLS